MDHQRKKPASHRNVSLIPWGDYNKLSKLTKENMESIETIRKTMAEKAIASSLHRFN